MRTTPAKWLAATAFVLLCAACSKPQPPDKEQPVEPQAEASATTA